MQTSYWCLLLTKPTRKPDGKRPADAAREGQQCPQGGEAWKLAGDADGGHPVQGSLLRSGDLHPLPILPGKFSHSPSLCYHFHESFHAPLCRNEMVPVCALLTHCPPLCYTPNDILLQATRLTTHWRRGGLGALQLRAWPDADRPAWPSHHHTHRNTFLQSCHPCHCTLMWK